ncbi:MAG: hemerythrin [Fibrobacteres bacterium]|nr:hemerythrin [Fibrobacterota bacterium]
METRYETESRADGHADWRSKPLTLLIDYLVANHKAYREHVLTNMERLLGLLQLEMGLAPAPAVEALADFRNFRQEFTWHMDEEESFIFPKILRTERCLHDPDLYPEIFQGSVGIMSPAHIHLPEEAFREMLDALTRKVHALPLQQTHLSHIQGILDGLNAFAARLRAHTYLESEILFPWASEMEAELRKRAARGML